MKQYTDMDRLKALISKHLNASYSFNAIHGSGECCFENIAFCIGICQDAIRDQDFMALYERYLQKFVLADEIMLNDFVRTIMVNCLMYMGKTLGRRDGIIAEAFFERLNRVYGFSISGERIFYTDEERKRIKSVPAVWKSARIVKYELTSPYLRLPNVYDLLGFSVMYGTDAETDKRIDAVVRYVCGEKYQAEVKSGYGIGINKEKGFVKSAFYSIGWDIRLSSLTPRQKMLYMRLFSHIPGARNTEWYQTNLSEYKKAAATGNNEFLSEVYKPVRKTYWPSGCYMNFGRGKTERINGVLEVISEILSEQAN